MGISRKKHAVILESDTTRKLKGEEKQIAGSAKSNQARGLTRNITTTTNINFIKTLVTGPNYNNDSQIPNSNLPVQNA